MRLLSKTRAGTAGVCDKRECFHESVDQEGQAKWQSSEGVARLWMHKVTGAHAMCGKRGETTMGHTLCHSKFPKNLVPSSQSNAGVGGKEKSLDSRRLTTLAVDMLVGQDVPQLREWLTEELTEEQTREPETTGGGVTDVALVMTRAQAQTLVQEQQQSLAQQADKEVLLTDSRIENNDEGEVEDEPPFNFSDDFFTKTKNSNETRKEREQEPSLLPDRVSPGELRALQQADPSLEKVRKQADQDEGSYLCERGLLVRKPFSTEGKNLIVVPREIELRS